MHAELLNLFSEVSIFLFKKLRPVLLSRKTDQLADEFELIHLIWTLEKRHSFLQQLSNDAPDRPYIDLRPVGFSFYQQLRGSIP